MEFVSSIEGGQVGNEAVYNRGVFMRGDEFDDRIMCTGGKC